MTDKTLEQKAKALLRWRLTEKGEVPNISLQELPLITQYLLNNKYVHRSGKTIEENRYAATPEGKEWALKD